MRDQDSYRWGVKLTDGMFCVASMNVERLRVPSGRASQEDTRLFENKIRWIAKRIRDMDADVVALQELMDQESIDLLFNEDPIKGQYKVYGADKSNSNLKVFFACKQHMELQSTASYLKFPKECVLRKADPEEDGDYYINVDVETFSRPVLQVSLKDTRYPNHPTIECFTVHQKSKRPMRLDRVHRDNDAIARHARPLGSALSGLKRLAEAAALKVLVSNSIWENDRPHIVTGDFNDFELSDVSAILSGDPDMRSNDVNNTRRGLRNEGSDLYPSSVMEALNSFRHTDYSYIYQGLQQQIDNIFFSEHFTVNSPQNVWLFRNMVVWNDHIDSLQYLSRREQTIFPDHGFVQTNFVLRQNQ